MEKSTVERCLCDSLKFKLNDPFYLKSHDYVTSFRFTHLCLSSHTKADHRAVSSANPNAAIFNCRQNPTALPQLRCQHSRPNDIVPHLYFHNTSSLVFLNLSSPHRRQSHFLKIYYQARPLSRSKSFEGIFYHLKLNFWNGLQMAPLTFPAPITPVPSAPLDHIRLLTCFQNLCPRGFPLSHIISWCSNQGFSQSLPCSLYLPISSPLPWSLAAGTIGHFTIY